MTQSQELSDILRRLQLFEDDKAILDLLHKICVITDHGSTEEWMDLFTKDGSFDVIGPRNVLQSLYGRGGVAHQKGIRFSGQSGLFGFIGRRGPNRESLSMHATIRPLVELDGDKAKATSYYICTANINGQHVIYAMGRFIDQLKRGEDGRWRFFERLSVVSAPPNE